MANPAWKVIAPVVYKDHCPVNADSSNLHAARLLLTFNDKGLAALSSVAVPRGMLTH